MPLNIEIKARCADHAPLRAALTARGARRIGLDRQIDTYFQARTGRMKLREGTIENSLIHYERPDQEGPKRSEVTLARVPADAGLGDVLRAGLNVLVVVDKEREIWFAENVKIHLDDVVGLGRFVEIEAIDRDGSIGADRLEAQCREFMDVFAVRPEDLIDRSYSDMLL
ncbi:MAG: class IV adenylate cyclase [Rhodothermales bacterium]|nr:class IV adenylate cyclase [Rhodothermales bacterium]MBO6780970.1 class IV adenylate cyclase [Rhodothermales bacterium]